jgi:hypothetical protein
VSRKTPIAEPMFDALSRLMGALVGRDYAAVAAHSRGRLDAMDIQRRPEEDYQGPLALPPRDYYINGGLNPTPKPFNPQTGLSRQQRPRDR